MRIPVRPPADVRWYLRPFFWIQRRKYGTALDSALLWARSPPLFVGVATLYGMIDRRSSPIEPALRSLVTVRVSQINHCPFCVDLNSATLLARGAKPDKVQALDRWRASELFDERERVALDYAEAVTYPDRGVDDELIARLRRHFDDDAVVELTGLIAFQNLSSKFNSALGVAPQGFCRLPAQAGAAPDEPDSAQGGRRHGAALASSVRRPLPGHPRSDRQAAATTGQDCDRTAARASRGSIERDECLGERGDLEKKHPRALALR
jgi:AhpD family alkylhydroperoxidase